MLKKENLKYYQYEFELYVDRGSVKLKFPCTFYITWKAGKQEIQKKDPISPVDNKLYFNTSLKLITEVSFDQDQKMFIEKKTIISLYLNSASNPTDSRLVGVINIDLAICLNSNAMNELNSYPIQRCPDKQSYLRFFIKSRFIRQLPQKDNGHSITFGVMENSQAKFSVGNERSYENSVNKLRNNRKQISADNSIDKGNKSSINLSRDLPMKTDSKQFLKKQQLQSKLKEIMKRKSSQQSKDLVIKNNQNPKLIDGQELYPQINIIGNESNKNIRQNYQKQIEALKDKNQNLKNMLINQNKKLAETIKQKQAIIQTQNQKFKQLDAIKKQLQNEQILCLKKQIQQKNVEHQQLKKQINKLNKILRQEKQLSDIISNKMNSYKLKFQQSQEKMTLTQIKVYQLNSNIEYLKKQIQIKQIQLTELKRLLQIEKQQQVVIQQSVHKQILQTSIISEQKLNNSRNNNVDEDIDSSSNLISASESNNLLKLSLNAIKEEQLKLKFLLSNVRNEFQLERKKNQMYAMEIQNLKKEETKLKQIIKVYQQQIQLSTQSKIKYVSQISSNDLEKDQEKLKQTQLLRQVEFLKNQLVLQKQKNDKILDELKKLKKGNKNLLHGINSQLYDQNQKTKIEQLQKQIQTKNNQQRLLRQNILLLQNQRDEVHISLKNMNSRLDQMIIEQQEKEIQNENYKIQIQDLLNQLYHLEKQLNEKNKMIADNQAQYLKEKENLTKKQLILNQQKLEIDKKIQNKQQELMQHQKKIQQLNQLYEKQHKNLLSIDQINAQHKEKQKLLLYNLEIAESTSNKLIIKYKERQTSYKYIYSKLQHAEIKLDNQCKRVDQLEKQLESHINTMKIKNNQIANLQKKNTQMKVKIQENLRQIENLQSNNFNFQRVNQQIINKNQSLIQQISQFQKRQFELETNISQMKQRIIKLQEIQLIHNKIIIQNKNLNQEIQKTTNNLQIILKQKWSLQNQLDDQTKLSQQYQKQKLKLTDLLRNSQAQLVNSHLQMEKLHKEIQMLKKQNKLMKENKNNYDKELETLYEESFQKISHINVIELKNHQLEQDYNSLQKQFQKLKYEYKLVVNQNQIYLEETFSLKDEIRRILNQNSQMAQFQNKYNQSITKNEISQKRIIQLEDKLSNLQNELNKQLPQQQQKSFQQKWMKSQQKVKQLTQKYNLLKSKKEPIQFKKLQGATENRIIKEVVQNLVKMNQEQAIITCNELQHIIISLVQRNKILYSKNYTIHLQKIKIQEKARELSLQLQKYKMLKLKDTKNLEQKKQILMFVKPFQVKISELIDLSNNFTEIQSEIESDHQESQV